MMEGWAIRQARVGVSVTLASRSDTGPGPEVQMRTGKKGDFVRSMTGSCIDESTSIQSGTYLTKGCLTPTSLAPL